VNEPGPAFPPYPSSNHLSGDDTPTDGDRLAALLSAADLETLVHSAAEVWSNTNQDTAQREYLSQRQVDVLNRAVRLLDAADYGLPERLTRLVIGHGEQLTRLAGPAYAACDHAVACPCLAQLAAQIEQALRCDEDPAGKLAAFLWDNA
jgi:hypothetical protein